MSADESATGRLSGHVCEGDLIRELRAEVEALRAERHMALKMHAVQFERANAHDAEVRAEAAAAALEEAADSVITVLGAWFPAARGYNGNATTKGDTQ